MRRLITILVVLLVFGLPLSAFAQDSAEVTITGQVINGTEGGGSVTGIEVTLITYINDMMADTKTAKTDGEGTFQFDNIAAEHQYLLSARYMEVDYYYPVILEPGETTGHVEVGVCDTTTSAQAISVGLAHTVISVEEESIKITEVFWLVNNADRTYVGTDGVLVFTLPEGATDFEAPQELMPDYQLRNDDRVAYLVPFPPGERQLFFSYRLVKPNSNEFSLPLEISYPTDSLEVMVQGEGVEVTIPRLAPAEPVFTGTGERFIHFRGENLPRGTVIDLRINNLSEDSELSSLFLGSIIIVVIAGITIYLMRRRKRETGNE